MAKAPIKHFLNVKESENSIRHAVNVAMDWQSLFASLKEMNIAFAKPMVNEEAKMDLQPNALNELPDMIQFVTYCGKSANKELKKVVGSFEAGRGIFLRNFETLPRVKGDTVFGWRKEYHASTFNVPNLSQESTR